MSLSEDRWSASSARVAAATRGSTDSISCKMAWKAPLAAGETSFTPMSSVLSMRWDGHSLVTVE